jgi:hypothetical protein
MKTSGGVILGAKVQIQLFGYNRLFNGREGTFLGYTRAGWARVRVDDASAWESLLSADRDEATGLPIVFVAAEELQSLAG